MVATLLPIILAIVAFYGTNAREFFDNKVKEVKLEKRELKLQIDSLNRIKEKYIKDSLFISQKYRHKMTKKVMTLK